MSTKPPGGTRDFLPADVRRREYVIGVVRRVYERYGFEPLETPAFENIETLLGKYGEEGNKLIFKILRRGEHEASGEADLALYQFGTKTAKHYFCRHCGVSPFTRPRLDPSRWAVNVRCLDGVDVKALPVSAFDGEHWDEAAEALRAKMRKPPAA